jgi:cell division protein FtsZ
MMTPMRIEVVELPSAPDSVRPTMKAVGVGGAGCNIVARSSLDKMAICRGSDGLHSPVQNRFVLKESEVKVCRTSQPHILASHDLPWMERMLRSIDDPQVLFLFSGMGGETGSYVSPVLMASTRRTFSISSVSLPFSAEGPERKASAKDGLDRLKEESDIMIVYANDALIKLAPNLPLSKAFSVMDHVMTSIPEDLASQLTVESLPVIKREFHGLEMRLGIGYGLGFNKERLAVEEALDSPWFPSKQFKPRTGLMVIAQAEPDVDTVKGCLEYLDGTVETDRIIVTVRKDPSLDGRVRVSLMLGYSF